MSDQIKEDEMYRTCSMHGRKINSYEILVGKPEGKELLGRPRYKWEDEIRIYLREVGWEGVDWIHFAQN
jgi:hypothetical protein